MVIDVADINNNYIDFPSDVDNDGDNDADKVAC